MRKLCVWLVVGMGWVGWGCVDEEQATGRLTEPSDEPEVNEVKPWGYYRSDRDWCVNVIRCGIEADKAGRGDAAELVRQWEAHRETVRSDGITTDEERADCHCTLWRYVQWWWDAPADVPTTCLLELPATQCEYPPGDGWWVQE